MDSNELQRACVSTLKAGSRSIGRSIEAASMLLGRKAGFDGRVVRIQRRETPGSDPDVADRSLARQAQTQLEAIRAYAEFVRQHPDMPEFHLRHCLGSALAECAQLEETLKHSLARAVTHQS